MLLDEFKNYKNDLEHLKKMTIQLFKRRKIVIESKKMFWFKLDTS